MDKKPAAIRVVVVNTTNNYSKYRRSKRKFNDHKKDNRILKTIYYSHASMSYLISITSI